jgi:hypothetical protein
MRWIISFLFLTFIFSACQDGLTSGSEKTIEEIKADGEVSSIIRNPVTATENADTVNVAKMVFEEDSYDFQEVLEGDVVKHSFHFKNEGKVPLIISGARSTCGCTVPEWPKDPIAPGEKGVIEVKFDTKNKKNKQSKPVTITANTYPAQTKVFLTGFVIPREEN